MSEPNGKAQFRTIYSILADKWGTELLTRHRQERYLRMEHLMFPNSWFVPTDSGTTFRIIVIRKERIHKERESKLEKRMAQAKQDYTKMYKVYCQFGFDGVREQFGYKFSQVNFVNQCKRYVDEYKPQNGKKRGK